MATSTNRPSWIAASVLLTLMLALPATGQEKDDIPAPPEQEWSTTKQGLLVPEIEQIGDFDTHSLPLSPEGELRVTYQGFALGKGEATLAVTACREIMKRLKKETKVSRNRPFTSDGKTVFFANVTTSRHPATWGYQDASTAKNYAVGTSLVGATIMMALELEGDILLLAKARVQMPIIQIGSKKFPAQKWGIALQQWIKQGEGLAFVKKAMAAAKEHAMTVKPTAAPAQFLGRLKMKRDLWVSRD